MCYDIPANTFDPGRAEEIVRKHVEDRFIDAPQRNGIKTRALANAAAAVCRARIKSLPAAAPTPAVHFNRTAAARAFRQTYQQVLPVDSVHRTTVEPAFRASQVQAAAGFEPTVGRVPKLIVDDAQRRASTRIH